MLGHSCVGKCVWHCASAVFKLHGGMSQRQVVVLDSFRLLENGWGHA